MWQKLFISFYIYAKTCIKNTKNIPVAGVGEGEEGITFGGCTIISE